MFVDKIEKSKINVDNRERIVLAHNGEDYTERYIKHVKKVYRVGEGILKREGETVRGFHNSFQNDYNIECSFEDFYHIIEKMILYHDLGKFNPKFQKNKLNNKEFQDVKIPEGIYSDHSIIGTIFLSIELLENYDLEDNLFLFIFANVIHGHHTRLRNVNESKYSFLSLFGEQKFAKYGDTIGYIYQTITENKSNQILSNRISRLRKLYKGFLGKLESYDKYSSLSYFYNYIYSVLIKADSIATSHSDKSIKYFDDKLEDYYNRIDSGLFYKMKNGIKNKSKEYKNKVEESPLNTARNKMQKEAISNLKKGMEKGKSVFYLKMPTGGGKTHTALELSIEIKENSNADRIIYALPFMSLLEQNYSYLRKVMNLKSQDEIRAIYSESSIYMDNRQEDIKDIITYDDMYEYPVICTTTVSIFNAIMKFNKIDKYRFSSLSNSIIILDEVQTLPIEYWPEFNYILNELSKNLNTYIIIMSATLPGLEKLQYSRQQEKTFARKAHYLLNDEQQYYEKFDRNEIISDNFENISIKTDLESDDLDELVEFVFEKCSNNFKQGHNHGLIIVNTVSLSKLLYREISKLLETKNDNIECVLLNSTLISAKKRQIMDIIDDLDREEKFILISTQSVEAGMDISFDFVIRDFTTLESIEQARGRCNREKEIQNGKVYLTKINQNGKTEANKIYKKWRLKETEKILKETNFKYNIDSIDQYFDNCIDKINRDISKEVRLTSADNIKCWNRLEYEETDSRRNKNKEKFHVDVIEENHNSVSFFVEMDLDKELFSENELEYLKNKSEYYPEIDPIQNQEIRGEEVLRLYCEEFKNVVEDGYTEKKILQRQFTTIISKFTFSTYIPVDQREKIEFMEQVGSFYIVSKEYVGEGEDKFYSPDTGVNKNAKLNNLLFF